MTPKLLQHTYGDIDIFYSEDIKEENNLNHELKLEAVDMILVRNFLELNTDHSQLIDAYAKKNNLERIAILFDHGEEIKNKWHYFNEGKSFPVQRWINKMDGFK